MTLRCDVDWLKEFVSGGHAPDMTVVFVYDLSDSKWDDDAAAPQVRGEALKNLAPGRPENGAEGAGLTPGDAVRADGEHADGLKETSSGEDGEDLDTATPQGKPDAAAASDSESAADADGEKNAGAGTGNPTGEKYLGYKYVRKLLGRDMTDSLNVYYFEFPYCEKIRKLNDDDSGKPVQVSRVFLNEMKDDILSKLDGKGGFVKL